MKNRSAQIAGALMITGALLANVGFLVLGSRFDYPDVLGRPAPEVLAMFHDDAAVIAALFALLALASAVMIPIAWLSRSTHPGGRTRQVMVVAGIAAGVVQVIGLLRWPLFVPGLADTVADPATTAAARADAVDTFQTLHDLLGGVIGESFGYALTAVWTLAMVRGLQHRPGRWFAPLGTVSAVLIATGLLEKAGVEIAGLTNFVGYLAWSGWMIALGIFLIRRYRTPVEATVGSVDAGSYGGGMSATHVVFGTGPAGTAVAEALVAQGTPVRMVNRSGRPSLADVETVGGDATDVSFARSVTGDAEAVYFCLNASRYDRWAEEFPPLQQAVVSAAAAAGAKLVVLENLYLYGPTDGPIREDTPSHPTSTKSRTRAAMSAELLDAHRRGDVRVAIGRAADFVGPGVRSSALGEFVFEPAVRGKRAQTMGRVDAPHTYTYVPDLGRNLVLLASSDEAYGRAWHLPNPPTRPTREIIADIYAAAGSTQTGITALNLPMIRVLGLFNRSIRELRHTYYQFAAPFVVDDGAFRSAFGGHTTEWPEIIGATVEWYREHLTPPLASS